MPRKKIYTVAKTQEIDIKPRKFKKENKNMFISQKCKCWIIRAISLFIVLASLAIILWHCLVDFKPDKILEMKRIKWRFPNANFDSCCSSFEKKQYYLKTCNTIFNQENIECFNLSMFGRKYYFILEKYSNRP